MSIAEIRDMVPGFFHVCCLGLSDGIGGEGHRYLHDGRDQTAFGPNMEEDFGIWDPLNFGEDVNFVPESVCGEPTDTHGAGDGSPSNVLY